MKITAGFGSIDAYPQLAQTGADELFCGYVPFDRVSCTEPLNRREVRAANAQIGSESELMILADMKREIDVPVTIAFNALCYTPEQLNYISNLIERCVERGFERFIIADPALAVRIAERKIPAKIHISGELGEMNRYVVRMLRSLGAERIIFHRRMSIDDMALCVSECPELEYEAFALNELCHFHGGYCGTIHCDMMDHMCREPYRLDGMPTHAEELNSEALGVSGCGLCALYRLREAGITHLKIVGRGNYPELTLRDVKMMKRALTILEKSQSEEEYISEMKSGLFDADCPGKCYYLPKI